VKPEDVQLLHHTPKVYLVIDPRYEDPVDSAFDEESENAQMVQYAHDEDVDESAYEEANAPYCLKGHKMMSSAYSKGSYKGGYCWSVQVHICISLYPSPELNMDGLDLLTKYTFEQIQ
jgi:hypothetical protein